MSTVSRRSLEPRASEIMALYRSSGFISMFCVGSKEDAKRCENKTKRGDEMR
jgi:hypothetical protein